MGFPSHGQVCEDRHAAWNSKAGAMQAMIHQVIDSSLPGDIWWCLPQECGYGSIPMKIPFLGEWTSINPSYFDVNYRGTIGFDTLACWKNKCIGIAPGEINSRQKSWNFSKYARDLHFICKAACHQHVYPTLKERWCHVVADSSISSRVPSHWVPLLRSCMMRGGVHARGRDWETEATGRIWHDLTLVGKPTSSCDRISSAEITGSHACVCLHSAYLEAQSRCDFRTWMVCCWLGFFKKNSRHICNIMLCAASNCGPQETCRLVIPETSNIFGGTIIFGCTFNMYCWLQPHHCCLFRPM